MEYCFRCGIEDTKALLYSVISPKGIVKICRRCNLEEEFPLIKQVSLKKESIEKTPSVKERLSNYAGINLKSKNFKKNEELEEQEIGLKKIIDENFRKSISVKNEETKSPLIHNFHWIIMRARRSKKLTQSQFAHEIQEPEEAIRTIEQGIVPKEYDGLILKIENYLGINLRDLDLGEVSDEIDSTKREVKKKFEERKEFDNFTTRNLTISDLKNMRNSSIKFEEKDFLDPFQKDDVRKLKEETDLTDEEIEKIIYGERN